MVNMTYLDNGTKSAGQTADWRQLTAPYRHPNIGRSLWQLTNTLIPFILVLCLMYLSQAYSYWITLTLAPLAAGFGPPPAKRPT